MGFGSNGSFISGRNPFQFNSESPLTLLLVQIIIIILFSRLIKYILKPLNQPSVIAEIITGIVLGPTVFGHIPGYNKVIFPKESIPFLTLTTNIGLILFLFLVGLELEPKKLKNGVKRALFISIAGMALPFGVGAAVSYGLYKIIEEDNISVQFPIYLIFIGVTMSITAFPVLARILIETKLLKTFVGNIVMCSAAVDDCASWCLLAIVSSLVNSKDLLQALYVFLLGLGYAIFMIFGVKYALVFVLKKTNSFSNGPSTTIVCLIFMIVYISSFVTDAIGIDATLGGFLAGTIIPHNNGFALKLTEKIEDVVTILFLPFYFTVSGLKTQLGALNDGKSWGMTILVLFVACFGKIFGCTMAAKLSKLKWRDSIAVGVLMNCKGLIELIFLNIGHNANVISDKTFAIMVIMALVTTFVTTPLALLIYPKSYHKRQIDKKCSRLPKNSHLIDMLNILVCVNSIENITSVLNTINLFHIEQNKDETLCISRNESFLFNKSIKVYAARFLEVTERHSSIMMYSELDPNMILDPVANMFKALSKLTNISSQTLIRICPLNEYCDMLNLLAYKNNTQLLLIPWNEATNSRTEESIKNVYIHNQTPLNSQYASFIDRIYEESNVLVGVLIEKELDFIIHRNSLTKDLGLQTQQENIIYVPCFGGPDDNIAIELSLRFSLKKNIKVNIVYYKHNLKVNLSKKELIDFEGLKQNNENNKNTNTETKSKWLSKNEIFSTFEVLNNKSIIDYISDDKTKHNVNFFYEESNNSVISFIEDACKQSRDSLIILGRNKNTKFNNTFNTKTKVSNNRPKVLGTIAETLLTSDCIANLLVVQNNHKKDV